MEDEKTYKVYVCSARSCYSGYSLIAAENSEEATKIVKDFQKYDALNKSDSWGYYEEIDEQDAIECLTSDQKGIVYSGIYYSG